MSKLTVEEAQDQVGETTIRHGQEYTIAGPDKVHYSDHFTVYDFPDDKGLYEYGTCHNCGEELIGWAKESVCPVCEESTHLT
jgi:rubrerythrin